MAEARRPVSTVILPDDKENIVNLLVDPNNNRHRVVCIIGQEGLGKTTLARKIYNSYEVKKWFKYKIWLSVSRQNRLQDVLKTILEKIRPLPLTEDEEALLQDDNQHSRQATEEHFLIKLKVHLQQKQYLIILDDVWTQDLWIRIGNALADVNNGSRVLVTTRSSEIARTTDPICAIYNLSCLSDEESQKLLRRKAFPNQDLQTFPPILSDLPKQFGERCDGLPLALLVVGGLLSREEPSHNSWDKVLKELNEHDGEGILATSYKYLPDLLKPCFMYFGLFPADHDIKVKPLIRMWVAEGFIPREDEKTMEETAEEYLEELIGRCMIQVSQRYRNGSIKYCCIQDRMHDLAVSKGRANGFLEIIPSQDENWSSGAAAMRLAALRCDYKDILENRGPSNLSSLLFFSTGNFPNVQRYKHLMVLTSRYPMKIERAAADSLKELAQLRYIGISMKLVLRLTYFRCGPISLSENLTVFWKSITCMKNLQTLHITKEYEDFGLPKPYDCIWDIETLRHVILPEWCSGPPSKCNLPNLQTLEVVRVRKEWLSKRWPKMPNIRVLKFCRVPSNYRKSFSAFLNGLRHLTSLHMGNKDDLEMKYEMPDLSTFPCLNNLQSLLVSGKWTYTKTQNGLIPRAITRNSFPVHLIKLKLMHSRIQEDPMPVLEKMENLQVLHLVESAYEGRQLSCSARGFPRLQYLALDGLTNLEEWKADVAGRSMPMLEGIQIIRCFQLRFIPELQYMTTLTTFTLHGGSTHLFQSLREEGSHKIRDGQFVRFDISNGLATRVCRYPPGPLHEWLC